MNILCFVRNIKANPTQGTLEVVIFSFWIDHKPQEGFYSCPYSFVHLSPIEQLEGREAHMTFMWMWKFPSGKGKYSPFPSCSIDNGTVGYRIWLIVTFPRMNCKEALSFLGFGRMYYSLVCFLLGISSSNNAIHGMINDLVIVHNILYCFSLQSNLFQQFGLLYVCVFAETKCFEQWVETANKPNNWVLAYDADIKLFYNIFKK
jgi:hypothetical protein